MGNQEKAAKGDTVLATSTRLFKGRVVEDTDSKAGESLLASTPVVVLSAILGRTPDIEEYKQAVAGIDLTKFQAFLRNMPHTIRKIKKSCFWLETQISSTLMHIASC